MTRCARSTRPNGGSSTRTPKLPSNRAEAWSRSSVSRVAVLRQGRQVGRGARRVRRPRQRARCRRAGTRRAQSRSEGRQTEDLRERQTRRLRCPARGSRRAVSGAAAAPARRARRVQGRRDARCSRTSRQRTRRRQRRGDRLRDNAANENRTIEVRASCRTPAAASTKLPASSAAARSATTRMSCASRTIAGVAMRHRDGRADVAPAPVVGPPEAPETTHQIADLAAGAIGSVASYLADQLGELFAPTPPEVREAQAKADAKREAEKPSAGRERPPLCPPDRRRRARCRGRTRSSGGPQLLGGAGPRQRLGTGPVTGPLERPSQGAPENRKATNPTPPRH